MGDNKLKNSVNLDAKSLITIFLIVVPGFIFGLLGKPVEMGLAIVSGALASSFINIDKIDLIQGAGFQARFKRLADEAFATLETLRSFANPLIFSMLNLVVYHDRISGMGYVQEVKIIRGLEEIAEILKLDTSGDFNKVKDTYFRFRVWDQYVLFINSVAQDVVGGRVKLELEQLKDYEADEFPSEMKIKEIIKPYNEVITTETNERLKDYLYFKTNRQFRRM